MNRLLIGCPVRRRAWILRHWFVHAGRAVTNAGFEPDWIFAVDPGDRDTINELHLGARWWGAEHIHIVELDEPDVADHPPSGHRWPHARVRHLADIRNQLLAEVRDIAPALFWSVDSDILLHPEALVGALETMRRVDAGAVGSKCYMEAPPRTECPSYAFRNRSGGLVRPDTHGTFVVDVIMAIKLMTPYAYSVDYAYHRDGEDVAWSDACRAAGVKLAWDGRYTSKHVLAPAHTDANGRPVDWLTTVDTRCGF